jgi:regulator of CtrA degradation
MAYMPFQNANQKLSKRVVEALMIEALLLNDELRSYFDGEGRLDRAKLDPIGQVTHASESLKATTRLMHITAWLMSRRSRVSSEDENTSCASARLGNAENVQSGMLDRLADEAQRLILASVDLYDRVERLDEQFSSSTLNSRNPALLMLQSIEQRLASGAFR